MQPAVHHLNPPALHTNPGYSQAVAVAGPATTVYVGGQNSVDQQGAVVSQGDLKAQALQALANVRAAVQAAGGDLEHVVKWTVYVVEGQPVPRGFEAFVETWGDRPDPPAVTVVIVSGLAHPDYLVEIDAVAVIPA